MMEGFDTKAVNFYYYTHKPGEIPHSKGIRGEVTFGKPLESRFDTYAGFVWLDILREDHWMTNLNEFSIPGVKKFRLGSVKTAAFDTGTSGIGLPTPIYNEFIQLFNNPEKITDAPGGYMILCAEANRIDKRLRFVLNGIPFEIRFADIFRPLPPSFDKCKVLVHDSPTDDISLGTPFHYTFYVSYDYTRSQVGIARKKDLVFS